MESSGYDAMAVFLEATSPAGIVPASPGSSPAPPEMHAAADAHSKQGMPRKQGSFMEVLASLEGDGDDDVRLDVFDDFFQNKTLPQVLSQGDASYPSVDLSAMLPAEQLSVADASQVPMTIGNSPSTVALSPASSSALLVEPVDQDYAPLPPTGGFIPDLLQITVEPSEFARFRYRSEGREKPLEAKVPGTYPQVSVNAAYRGMVPPGTPIHVSLVCRNPDAHGNYIPHCHVLQGELTVPVDAASASATFSTLTVIIEKAAPRTQVRKEDQRSARLLFTMNFQLEDGTVCHSTVVTGPIFNSKLDIMRVSHPSGPSTGNFDIILLTSKTRKSSSRVFLADKGVRWDPEVHHDSNRWTHTADGRGAIVLPLARHYHHHQFAIAVSMPPYYDTSITTDHAVVMQVVDYEDQLESKPVEFVYSPSDAVHDQMQANSKKRRIDSDRSRFSNNFFGGGDSGSGSGGSSSSGGGGPSGSGDDGKSGGSRRSTRLGGRGNNSTGGGGSTGGFMEFASGPSIAGEDFLKAMQLYAATGDLCYVLALQQQLLGMPDEEDGETPLHYAVEHGQVGVLEKLLRVADADALRVQNDRGETALHMAARLQRRDMVERLVEAGALLSLRTRKGETALHLACAHAHGSDAIVRCMLSVLERTGPELPYLLAMRNYTGHTPVLAAASVGNAGILHSLVHFGADPNATDAASGNSAVHVAVERNDRDVLSQLIAANADLELENMAGDTPMHIAARRANVSVMRTLLSNGASEHRRNVADETPIHVFAEAVKLARAAKELSLAASSTAVTDDAVTAATAAPTESESTGGVVDEAAGPAVVDEPREASVADSDADDYVVIEQTECDVKISADLIRYGPRAASRQSRSTMEELAARMSRAASSTSSPAVSPAVRGKTAAFGRPPPSSSFDNAVTESMDTATAASSAPTDALAQSIILDVE